MSLGSLWWGAFIACIAEGFFMAFIARRMAFFIAGAAAFFIAFAMIERGVEDILRGVLLLPCNSIDQL
jgi:hypothetical protein